MKRSLTTIFLLMMSFSEKALANNDNPKSDAAFYRIQHQTMQKIDAYLTENAWRWVPSPTKASEFLSQLNDPQNKERYQFTHLYGYHQINLGLNVLKTIECSRLTTLEHYRAGSCPGQILVELDNKNYRVYGTDARGYLLTHHGQVMSFPASVAPAKGLLKQAYTGSLQLMPWDLPFINQADKLGRSPLWWASLSQTPYQVQNVTQLRQAGAKINPNPWIQVPETVLAAASGNLAWLQNSLQQTPEKQGLSHMGNDGYTPLMAAAEHGHLELVHYLLQQGANVHAVSYREYQALDLAIEQGHNTVIEALLQAGAKPTGNTWIVASGQGRLKVLKQLNPASWQLLPHAIHDGSFAIQTYADGTLEAAAKGGHLDTVKWLIEKGVTILSNTNPAQDDGNALGLAATNGQLEVLDFLLQRLPNYPQNHLLKLAVKQDQVHILRYLHLQNPKRRHTTLSQAMIEAASNNALKCFDYAFNTERFRDANTLNQALKRATLTKNLNLIQILLQAGADVNSQEEKGITPLMVSIQNSDIKTTKYLLANGADPNLKNTLTNTSPLISAIHTGQLPLIEALIEAGADTNPREQFDTPLTLAVKKGKTELVTYLLKKGANPNTKNFSSPLLVSVLAKNTQIVKLLLEAGADINTSQTKVYPEPSTRHITGKVIHIAAAMNQKDVVNLLLKREKKEQIQAALFAALANNHEPLVDWLLTQTPDLNAQSKEGETLLMRVAASGDIKRFQALVTAGADPRKRTHFGDSALAYAVHAPSLELFEQLLKSETDNLAIQQALIQTIVTGQRSAFESCLRRLNNVNFTDYLGNTPLMYTIMYNRLDWLTELIALGSNVNQSNKWGETPLMFAVANKTPPEVQRHNEPQIGLPTAINYGFWPVRLNTNSNSIIPILIHAGADPNAQDKEKGDTALLKAVAEGNVIGVQHLLTHGVNLRYRNLSGYSVKDFLLDNIEYDKKNEDWSALKRHMQIQEILETYLQKNE